MATKTNPSEAPLNIYSGEKNDTTYFTFEGKCLMDMIGDNPSIECDYFRVINSKGYIPFITHHVGENMLFNLDDYKEAEGNAYFDMYWRLLNLSTKVAQDRGVF